MARVDFGMFDWIDRGKAPVQQLYAQRLQLVEEADAADSIATTWRSITLRLFAMAPSPALFLTAAAQRTKRIHLGPLVYLLPLYNLCG